ncbi:hypothetical protein LN42_01995 [Marinitoga sp. 1137]|uniref:hypothetical protein n=1 Tax=Marinitoga sp. 1137 TaxID=1545835 RepID=UPI0009508231|nr:hypothetical protein [Marinitoga sp. 1137]APT75296.1 hypothetical protein LN42_01995 [Marinitoga sp. 1137]
MALIKTPYNLIYNDDGSLCVTLRDDDVPFEGVKSFAVEEGTENLLATSGYDPGKVYSGTTYPFLQWNITDKIQTTWIDEGDGYCTYSWQFEGKKDSGDGYPRFYLWFGDWSWNINTAIPSFDFKKSILQVRMPNPTNKSVFFGVYHYPFNSSGRSYAKNMQLERKAFSTSFVNGARPYGQFKFNQNWDYNNVVFSTWFKINKVNNPYPRIFDQTPDDTNSVDDFGFYYEQITSKFKLKANTIELLSPYISNSDVTNKWWFVVIGFDNDIGFIKLYDENSLFWDTTFTNNINNESVKQYMFKIGDSGTKQRLLNGLISNLFIGDYKDKDGNVIWTDEFIQEIYNAKKPFAVPAKIPII